ncbi:MAG TPA: DUF2892 domain-containing protein [candidate division Zixibacteria bacterium]
MKCNVGPVDRIIRLILGAVIILLGAIFNSWWGLIGVAVFLTGIIGWCGLYIPLGINTCKTKTPEGTDTTKEDKP